MHLTFNPAEIITGWTALVAVLSLANKYILGAYAPNLARFISVVISIPIGHIANAIEDAQQLVADVQGPPPPPADGPTPPAVVTAPPNPPPAPAAARVGFNFVAGVFAVALAVGGLLAFGGCTPAQSVEMSNIESTILGDLVANKSQAQVEQDVAAIVGGKFGVDVVILVDDALVLLIDSGTLTASELTAAQTLLGQVHPTAVGHRALRDAK